MNNFHTLSELDSAAIHQYRNALQTAFPKIIQSSEVIKNYWERLENYFPNTQVFLLDKTEKLIGFMNAIPIYWDQPLEDLPDEGWDWLLKKGIQDCENNIPPNYLGGLQIIVTKNFQNQGHSSLLINEGKRMVQQLGYKNLIIPIRPILKHNFPDMQMKDYVLYKTNDKLYDPWIRTHLSSGAKIINVCSNSMYISGDMSFWKNIIDEPISASGSYHAKGALNSVNIDIENDKGVYREENIWIYYK